MLLKREFHKVQKGYVTSLPVPTLSQHKNCVVEVETCCSSGDELKRKIQNTQKKKEQETAIPKVPNQVKCHQKSIEGKLATTLCK